MPALNRAVAILTDPAECGPVTLAFCQDVQAEAYDYPASFFDERVHRSAARSLNRARSRRRPRSSNGRGSR